MEIWGLSVLRGCVVGTKCVSECILYRPMVIQPLLHRAGPRTDCRTARGQSFQPHFFTQHSPQRACHSGTVLRASLLAIFTYNATASGMDVLWLILTKADEALEIQASVGKSSALHFVSVRQTSRQTLFQFTLFGASRHTLFQSWAQRRAGHRDGLRQRNSFTSVHLTGLS